MEILSESAMVLLIKDVDYTDEDIEATHYGDRYLKDEAKKRIALKHGFKNTYRQYAEFVSKKDQKTYLQIELIK